MNYQLYQEWLKLRAKNEVPPAKPSKKTHGFESDFMDSIRDGSST